ncbi:hypothetical protein, partial [Aliikangiella sp. G2MR2-5]
MGREYKLLVGDQEVLRPYQESIALAQWPERWAFFGDFLLLLTKSYLCPWMDCMQFLQEQKTVAGKRSAAK